MNAVAKIEALEAWAVEERMADGRWRVPRHASTWPRDHSGARRDEYWDDGEYRAWTFLRSLVERGILGWLDECEVGFEPAEYGCSFHNPKGGIFCNRNRLADGGRGPGIDCAPPTPARRTTTSSSGPTSGASCRSAPRIRARSARF